MHIWKLKIQNLPMANPLQIFFEGPVLPLQIWITYRPLH